MHEQAPHHTTIHRRRRLKLGMLGLIAGVVSTACAEVGSAPDVPAAIEFARFPYPTVVVGDSLRQEDGLVAPVRAIVRNSSGEEIVGAPVVYLYADYNRDSAILVDSTTGMVVALKKPTFGTTGARIAARVGSSLQIVRNLLVSVQPDTVSGSAPDSLKVSLPDSVSRNSTGPFQVTVRHADSLRSTVEGWIVRYKLLYPANPTNDSTLGAYLVTERYSPSTVDTTNGNGVASRLVRVRPLLFPTESGTDSVVVEVTVQHHGVPVPGSPLRLSAPVIRPGG